METIMTKTARLDAPHPRSIVNLRAADPGRYVVCDENRSGMQYRPRHGIPGTLLDALDRDGAVFVFAYVDCNGRRRLQSLAPKQPW